MKIADLSERGKPDGRYCVEAMPGVMGGLPEPLTAFIEGLSFDEGFYLIVERAA